MLIFCVFYFFLANVLHAKKYIRKDESKEEILYDSKGEIILKESI